MEHERQRALQRKVFEEQMRALEQQQARELLSIPMEAQHLAVSAPTTPPRVNAVLSDDHSPTYPSALSHSVMDADVLSQAVGKADKRKSVTYAPSVNHSPEMPSVTQSFARPGGAKSMPASRRTSASEHDEELAGHLQGLSLAGERAERISTPSGSIPHSILRSNSGRFGNEYAGGYNAGMMLDEQLDKEMHSAYTPLFVRRRVSQRSQMRCVTCPPRTRTSSRTALPARCVFPSSLSGCRLLTRNAGVGACPSLLLSEFSFMPCLDPA